MSLNAADINTRQKFYFKLATKSKPAGSQNVVAQEAFLERVIINTASGTPTITIYDSVGTSTLDPIISFTPAAKDQIVLNVLCTSGIYCAISSCSPTLIYKTE